MSFADSKLLQNRVCAASQLLDKSREELDENVEGQTRSLYLESSDKINWPISQRYKWTVDEGPMGLATVTVNRQNHRPAV